jgi:hypothetical protein
MDIKNRLLKDLSSEDWISLINIDVKYKDIFLELMDQTSKKDIDCFVDVMIFHPMLSSFFTSYDKLKNTHITKLLLSGFYWDTIFKEKIDHNYLNTLNNWNIVDILIQYPEFKKRFDYLSDLTEENRMMLVLKTTTMDFDYLVDYDSFSETNKKILLEFKKDLVHSYKKRNNGKNKRNG